MITEWPRLPRGMLEGGCRLHRVLHASKLLQKCHYPDVKQQVPSMGGLLSCTHQIHRWAPNLSTKSKECDPRNVPTKPSALYTNPIRSPVLSS